MKNKTKKEFYDDGSTIADMNVKGMPWYQSPEVIKKKADLKNLNVSNKERKAMIKGALLAYLPMFIIILASFAVVILLFFLLFVK